MNKKKIFYIVSLVSALTLVSGVAFAAAPQKVVPSSAVIGPRAIQSNIKYTAQQQACIKAAQDKRTAAIKVAMDAINTATKDELKARQDAVKAAQDTFIAATKAELKVEQDALIAAQKNKDAKVRATEAKSANDAYNNDKVVKQAKVPYTAAVNAANDIYNNSPAVIKAKAPYAAAVKAANDQFQASLKSCSVASGHPILGFFQRIGSGISGSFSKMIKFFTGKK
jgi:hypothetical protein